LMAALVTGPVGRHVMSLADDASAFFYSMSRICRIALLFAVAFAAVEARKKKVVVEEPITFWEGVWNLLYAGLMSDGLSEAILSVILLVAGYKSFKAIESKDKSDDTTWLMFWFVYAVLQFVKEVLDYGFKVVFPYYNENCIALLVWLAFGGGGEFVYKLVRPLLVEYSEKIDDAAEQAKRASIENYNRLKAQYEKNS